MTPLSNPGAASDANPGLARLPEALRPSLLAMGSVDVDSMGDIVDMSQVYGHQPSQHTPHRHTALMASPLPFPDTQHSTYSSHSQSMPLSQWSQPVQPSVPPPVSGSRTPRNRNHWSVEDIEVLITAVHNHNPNKYRTNSEKGAAWQLVLEEVNTVMEARGHYRRSMQAIKEKWKHIAAAQKQQDRVLASSSGHVELRSDMERLVDDVLQADIASSYGRIGKENADQHRRRLSELTGRIHGTAASHSMSGRAQRQASAQDTPASSQLADSESESSIENITVSPSRKRARNAAHEALALMIENDEEQRQSDERYRSESLQIQRDMLNLGSSLFNTMTNDIKDMKNRFDSLENSLNRVVGLLTNQLPVHTLSSLQPVSLPSVPEEPHTPRRHREASVASSASLTPTHHAARPRRSSREPSQPRGLGRYGGFHT